MKPLTAYTDYRTYLAEVVADRKAKGLPASNRWFALRMNINSTSWLTMVVKGRIGLSKTTANGLSAVLRHSPTETRYFETLVCFNQARTIDDRNRYYQELVSLQKVKDAHIVGLSQYEYYSAWYHSAVRSLIGMRKFTDNFRELARAVSPPISEAQARKSVELLERLDLIAKNDQGVFELTASAVHSGEEVRSLALGNFQKETMRLAQEALDRHPRDRRYIGTMTVGVSEETFNTIKKLLIDTSRTIAEMAERDTAADRVCQVNLQAFPLSTPPVPRKDGRL